MENSDAPVHVVARTARLLRALATAGGGGAALTSLAHEVGLANATVHRLLDQLIQERLAMRVEGTRRYAIGPLGYEIGLAAAQSFDLRALFRPTLAALANATGETVYLVQRSGDEAVCVDLIEAPGPVRVVTLEPGSRRPLGLGAGGLAILAALPMTEGDEVLRVVGEAISREWQLSEEFMRRSLALARETGFAQIRNRITPGVTAIGRSFRDGLGRVIGAVSVAGVNRRMEARQLALVRPRLARAAAALEACLRSSPWPRYGGRSSR
jgi:DNA-binding IclR family transcriptional regulator